MISLNFPIYICSNVYVCRWLPWGGVLHQNRRVKPRVKHNRMLIFARLYSEYLVTASKDGPFPVIVPNRSLHSFA